MAKLKIQQNIRTERLSTLQKNTLPHFIDTINHYAHQYQKVLHELSPKRYTRDHSVWSPKQTFKGKNSSRETLKAHLTRKKTDDLHGKGTPEQSFASDIYCCFHADAERINRLI